MIKVNKETEDNYREELRARKQRLLSDFGNAALRYARELDKTDRDWAGIGTTTNIDYMYFKGDQQELLKHTGTTAVIGVAWSVWHPIFFGKEPRPRKLKNVFGLEGVTKLKLVSRCEAGDIENVRVEGDYFVWK